MARLGIDLESIAVIREAGNTDSPDPAFAVAFAEMGSADGIVCSVRVGWKPLTERDVRLVKALAKTHFTIKVPPDESLIRTAVGITPDMITLVPFQEEPAAGLKGLDLIGHEDLLMKVIRELRAQKIVVSLFVEPVLNQVKMAAKLGADYAELNAARYASTEDLNEKMDQLENIREIAMAASKIGLGVSASQGLNYNNVAEIAQIDKMEEIIVGHALTSRALWMGMEQAVRDMAALVH